MPRKPPDDKREKNSELIGMSGGGSRAMTRARIKSGMTSADPSKRLEASKAAKQMRAEDVRRAEDKFRGHPDLKRKATQKIYDELDKQNAARKQGRNTRGETKKTLKDLGNKIREMAEKKALTDKRSALKLLRGGKSKEKKK